MYFVFYYFFSQWIFSLDLLMDAGLLTEPCKSCIHCCYYLLDYHISLPLLTFQTSIKATVYFLYVEFSEEIEGGIDITRIYVSRSIYLQKITRLRCWVLPYSPAKVQICLSRNLCPSTTFIGAFNLSCWYEFEIFDQDCWIG